jgi:hypothetical protein
MLVWDLISSLFNLVMTIGSILELVVLVISWYELIEAAMFKFVRN